MPRPVRKLPYPRGVPSLVTGIVLTMLAAMPLTAQQTGTVVGTVVNGQTSEPLANVQVMVRGTSIGVISNNDGRFIINNVPAGEQMIEAVLIGYSGGRQTITLAPGATAQVSLTMRPSPVEMEGVVVTGTAIAAQKRELGHSISLMTSDELEAVGAMNVEDLLRGRMAGVSVTGTPGAAGAGSHLLLRGTHSVNGRNLPLIYIDGVRMSAGALEEGALDAAEHATYLGSIRPEDIDRIEVIKGAAASALYGTDAATGVIQIFTKKGAAGRPRWSFNMEQGVATIGHVGPDIDPTGLRVNDCTRQFTFNDDPAVMDYEIIETPDPGCPADGDWLRNAWVQDYSLSIRGGTEDITYYVSGGYSDQEGVIAPNNARDFNIRGNFSFQAAENLQIGLNNFYTRRRILWVPNGDNDEGLLYNVARGDEGETPDNDDSVVLDLELDQIINHFNTSANINWTPLDNLRNRLTVGFDYSNSNFTTFRPWGFWNEMEGDRTIDIENRRNITVDYATSWNTDLFQDFTSTLSFGGQYYQQEALGNRTDVEGFLGPGRHLLEDAVTVTNVNEDEDTEESGGFFLQEQLGWKNRLFITAGLRADNHSAFGPDYQAEHRFTYYPRVQAAYTISDHDFWPSAWFNTFRVRAAYGEVGEAPPASGSITIWEVAGADDGELGFIILNLANPALGPERTREYEGGFDASLFDDRLALNFTAFNRDTYDGLIFVAPAPSQGIAELIPQNVGKWEARGYEVGTDLLVYDGLDVRVQLNGNYQFTETKMIDLGDPQFDEFSFNYFNAYRRGRPIPALYGQELLNEGAVGELPQWSDADTTFHGPSRPPHEMSLGATVTLFERLTLDAYGVGQYGHFLYDDLAQELAADGLWPACFETNARVENGVNGDDPSLYANIPTAEIARCWQDDARDEAWIESADYFRLQSASISYRLPPDLIPGTTFSGATVQLRATNLFTITDFSGLYPDALIRPAEQTARGAGYILPPAKTFTLGVRLDF